MLYWPGGGVGCGSVDEGSLSDGGGGGVEEGSVEAGGGCVGSLGVVGAGWLPEGCGVPPVAVGSDSVPLGPVLPCCGSATVEPPWSVCTGATGVVAAGVVVVGAGVGCAGVFCTAAFFGFDA